MGLKRNYKQGSNFINCHNLSTNVELFIDEFVAFFVNGGFSIKQDTTWCLKEKMKSSNYEL